MNRLDFFPTTTVDGVTEVDQIGGNLSRFQVTRQPAHYRVTQEDLMRPDLISYKAYGTVDFWWVVCLANGITNPFLDMSVGDSLQIPSILDVYDFNKAFRVG